MRIVYIAGLGHSGSTILDMALGCNKQIVGLGEVLQVIKATADELETNYDSLRCACGQTFNQCDFWKDAKKILRGNSHRSLEEKYRTLIDYFKAKYGPDMILLDSSKIVADHLTVLAKHHDVKVIFLVRDIRSWCYSRHSRLKKNIFKLGLQWTRTNWGILRFLKQNKLEYKSMGYEEYALYPEAMLKEVCRFIGGAYQPDMLVPGNTHSHVVKGNVARGDNEKRKTISYDARWMTSLPIIFYSVLLFPFMFLNRKLVYSNFMRGKTVAFGQAVDDFYLFGEAQKEQSQRTVEGKK